MKLTVPYPISANEYWRTAIVKNHRELSAKGAKPFSTTYVSEEARSYKRKIKIAAYESGIRDPIKGRVYIHVQLYPHRPIDWAKRARKNPLYWDDDVRCIDLDNALKVLIDALRGIAYTDDAWVRRITAERMEPDAEDARVIIEILPIVRVDPQATIEGSGCPYCGIPGCPGVGAHVQHHATRQ